MALSMKVFFAADWLLIGLLILTPFSLLQFFSQAGSSSGLLVSAGGKADAANKEGARSLKEDADLETDAEDEANIDLENDADSTAEGYQQGSDPDKDDNLEDSMTVTGEDGEEDADESSSLGSSPDAESTVLFVQPTGTTGLELPATKIVEFLVGFSNKGKQDFLLETLDASFRYPMDFTYHIQNFTTIGYNRVVKPKQETSLSYSFIPSEAYAGRPFGLTVNLQYKDEFGNQFFESVFNETVQITELDEGLDRETFFIYIFLIAIVVLVLVGSQQLLVSLTVKSGGSGSRKKDQHHSNSSANGSAVGGANNKRHQIETGTIAVNGNVDFDWIPRQTLNAYKKAGTVTTQQRRIKRSSGSGSDS